MVATASAGARSSRRRSSRSRTARTTRRRRWASSRSTLIIAGWQSRRQPDPQTWVIVACGIDDRARHLHGWLAHHPHPRQGSHRRQARAGLLSRVLDGRHDPRLQRPRLRAVHHPGRLRLGDRIGSRPTRVDGALAHRRPHHGRLAAHAARRGRRRRRSLALIVAWLGGWGILIDAIFAVVVILTIFLLSRRNAVTADNAMSEVAESGTAVKVKRNPPPTRRQRADVRGHEARRAEGGAAK